MKLPWALGYRTCVKLTRLAYDFQRLVEPLSVMVEAFGGIDVLPRDFVVGYKVWMICNWLFQ